MRWSLVLIAGMLVGCSRTSETVAGPAEEHAVEGEVLFEELFEDTDWESRGWYDSPGMQITADEHIPGSGHSCVWHWAKAGDVGPANRGARVQLRPRPLWLPPGHVRHVQPGRHG